MKKTLNSGLLALTVACLVVSCSQQATPITVPSNSEAISSSQPAVTANAKVSTQAEPVTVPTQDVTVAYTVDPSLQALAKEVLTDLSKTPSAAQGSVQMRLSEDAFRIAFLTDGTDYVAMDAYMPGTKTSLAFNAVNSAKAYVLTDPVFVPISALDKKAIYGRLAADPDFPLLVERFEEAGRIVEDEATLRLVNTLAGRAALSSQYPTLSGDFVWDGINKSIKSPRRADTRLNDLTSSRKPIFTTLHARRPWAFLGHSSVTPTSTHHV